MTPVVTEALHDHYLSACHLNIYQPFMQLTVYVTKFNIHYTPPTHHLRMRKIRSETVSYQMTYLLTFDST